MVIVTVIELIIFLVELSFLHNTKEFFFLKSGDRENMKHEENIIHYAKADMTFKSCPQNRVSS